VNAAYNPTGATGNFFEVPPSSGIIAIDPSVSVDTLKTTDTGNAGANELALAVAQVQNTSFSTANGDQINGTISGYLASGVSGFGASLSSVTSQLDDQNTVQQMVESQRDSVSGVNEDDEMTDLMKYQRAFQASSQVINIVDNLLDVVVNGLVKN
jgi:flagellar hook-associated protein 1 FlgK